MCNKNKHFCLLWLLASVLVAGCDKQPAQENEPVPAGERSVVLRLAGDITSFDTPTKAPEAFIPSSSNLLYLYLVNSDGNSSVIGKGTYNEGNTTWLFTYEGSVSEGLTSGEVYGYLFEKDWNRYNSGADEYIQLGPKVPVYEARQSTFTFTRDTLFVDADFFPATSRISFTQDLADNKRREVQTVSGLRYYSRFYPNSFWMESSAESFYGGACTNQTFFYGNALFTEAPVMYYDAHGWRFVKRFPSTYFQMGQSGYVYLPQSSSEYEGWGKFADQYNWYIDGTRWMYFQFVPCGSFLMGGADAEPVHSVTLTESFYMMSTEVDQALWYQVMGEPEEYRYQQIPVTGKSWEEIQAFIAKMESYYKCHFRLPTEAEWEYAACGGFYDTAYSRYYSYSGSDTAEEVAWYEEDSESSLHTVQQKNGNELQIYDMSGNAAELCNDWYASYKDEAVTDPAGPATGTNRVVRGGSFSKDATWCTTTRRGSEADYSPSEIGFRLVLIPPSFPD